MEGKMKAGLLAILCLFGMSFAWGGFGMDMGLGNQFGMEKGMGDGKNISLETRAEFMQATHEGNYETAMELHEEYGIGGPRMEVATEEMFALMGQIFEAQVAGNWLEAATLHQELVKLTHELMGKGIGEKKAACEEAMNNAEVQELIAQIGAAKESKDKETMKSLHEQIKELVPQGCGMGMGNREGMPPGKGMPPEMSETCKLALEENKDALSALKEEMKAAKEAGDTAKADELKAQLKELMPEECPKGPRGGKMHGGEMEPPMPLENVE